MRTRHRASSPAVTTCQKAIIMLHNSESESTSELFLYDDQCFATPGDVASTQRTYSMSMKDFLLIRIQLGHKYDVADFERWDQHCCPCCESKMGVALHIRHRDNVKEERVFDLCLGCLSVCEEFFFVAVGEGFHA